MKLYTYYVKVGRGFQVFGNSAVQCCFILTVKSSFSYLLSCLRYFKVLGLFWKLYLIFIYALKLVISEVTKIMNTAVGWFKQVNSDKLKKNVHRAFLSRTCPLMPWCTFFRYLIRLCLLAFHCGTKSSTRGYLQQDTSTVISKQLLNK